MAGNESLDQKILEQTLEQHREARRTFHRDLRIACAILAMFQILLFVRFLQLDNERLQYEAQLAQLEQDRAALTEVSQRLDDVGASLDPLLTTLAQTPPFLREQIRVIETRRSIPTSSADPGCTPSLNCTQQSPAQIDPVQFGGTSQILIAPLEALASSATPSASTVPLDAACTDDALGVGVLPGGGTAGSSGAATTPEPNVIQQPPPAVVLPYDDFGAEALVLHLNGLPPADQEVLRTGLPVERYNELVESIVNDVAVPALFAGLNARKDQIVATSFATAQQGLCNALEGNRDSFDRYGLTPDEMLGRVDAVKAELLAHRIAPPADPSWWRLYPAKEAAASGESIEVTEFSEELLASDEAFETVATELATLIATVSEKKSDIDSHIADTEVQFEQVRATFNQIAAPLPWVPVELKYAVLYYPVILACLFLYFVVRYVTDRERARSILAQANAVGISPAVLNLYLADYSIPIVNTGSGARWNGVKLRPLLGVALLAPGIAFVVSVLMIVDSRGFVDDRRWYLMLYAASAVLFVIGYWQLALSLRKKVAP